MERPSPRSRTPEKQRMPSERSAIDRLHKHRASIFGTPDNVILQRENATAVFPISFAHSRQVYRCRSTNTKRATLRTPRLFRCRLKATVPKRNFYGQLCASERGMGIVAAAGFRRFARPIVLVKGPARKGR